VYRFVLQRRWLGLLALVVALAAVCVQLGMWQLDRVSQRRADNERITANLAAAPVPLADLLPLDGSVPEEHEWRPVTATGTYDAKHQVAVRYQSRDGVRGVNVVTPLVLADGRAVLVDRGWLPGDVTSAAGVPAPPSGVVTVTGWLRSDSSADTTATRPVAGQVRAISSAAVAETVPYPLYPGYLARTDQVPTEVELAAAQPPDLGQGPHFFYGLQWFFFAALALFGWFYLVWAEAHPRRRTPPAAHSARSMPPSTGSIAPLTNDAAGDSRNAAARANSSGRP